jgi:hypothetical protein
MVWFRYGNFYEAVRVILEESAASDSWLGHFEGFYRGFQASLMLHAVELLRDRVCTCKATVVFTYTQTLEPSRSTNAMMPAAKHSSRCAAPLPFHAVSSLLPWVSHDEMQQLVGNWRQQVVDTAVEWLGYVPDPAIPDVDSAGFPVPNEEWLQQRQHRGAFCSSKSFKLLQA